MCIRVLVRMHRFSISSRIMLIVFSVFLPSIIFFALKNVFIIYYNNFFLCDRLIQVLKNCGAKLVTKATSGWLHKLLFSHQAATTV